MSKASYDQVMVAIREFNSDTSRSQIETLEGLQDFKGEIDELIDALEGSIEMDEEE